MVARSGGFCRPGRRLLLLEVVAQKGGFCRQSGGFYRSKWYLLPHEAVAFLTEVTPPGQSTEGFKDAFWAEEAAVAKKEDF